MDSVPTIKDTVKDTRKKRETIPDIQKHDSDVKKLSEQLAENYQNYDKFLQEMRKRVHKEINEKHDALEKRVALQEVHRQYTSDVKDGKKALDDLEQMNNVDELDEKQSLQEQINEKIRGACNNPVFKRILASYIEQVQQRFDPTSTASNDRVDFQAREAFPINVTNRAKSDALMRYKNIEILKGEAFIYLKDYKEISDDLHIIDAFANHHYIDNRAVKAAMLRITEHDKDSWIYQSESIRAVVKVINDNAWIQKFLHEQAGPSEHTQELPQHNTNRNRVYDRPSSYYFVPKKHLESLVSEFIKCKQADPKAKFSQPTFIRSIDSNSTKTLIVIDDNDWKAYFTAYFEKAGHKKIYGDIEPIRKALQGMTQTKRKQDRGWRERQNKKQEQALLHPSLPDPLQARYQETHRVRELGESYDQPEASSSYQHHGAQQGSPSGDVSTTSMRTLRDTSTAAGPSQQRDSHPGPPLGEASIGDKGTATDTENDSPQEPFRHKVVVKDRKGNPHPEGVSFRVARITELNEQEKSERGIHITHGDFQIHIPLNVYELKGVLFPYTAQIEDKLKTLVPNSTRSKYDLSNILHNGMKAKSARKFGEWEMRFI